mgnify:CR=1 FL=1
MRAFTITENDAGQRVDKFISKAVKKLPKSLMYKYIRTKRIKLNRGRCEINTKLKEGDLLELYINDEFFDNDVDRNFLRAAKSLDIIYEDDNILLVNKPCGVVVHEDNKNTVDTLINRILLYLYEKKEIDPAKENSFTPALCNRIDRNTGGIVIAAKNAITLRTMNELIRKHLIDRKYLCLIQGKLPKEADEITAYHEIMPDENIVKITNTKTDNSKIMITRYNVLDYAGGISLIQAELITGRKHQIRAHFAHIGSPLIGDRKYGDNAIDARMGINKQALYSYKLGFRLNGKGGHLSYLDGKEFGTQQIWFIDKFNEYKNKMM